ncbi:MAG: adenylate cyclase [Rhodospirillales bacterium RIFCSPLOWO2_12_FULL_58_28]|nr:MAG: adenylate cyclase [Rhodospirillales bacterium RIFCSPLOWO2_02_FULL_58_16]OHC78400.1 MAG: adenylate cyclase [Rhodospirillales bacterium RIFCSPLOWO2_12_FULL_58_28]
MARIGKFLRKAFGVDRLMALALLAGFVFLYVSNPYPVDYLRLKTFDFYQKLKPREIPPPAQKPVTIIDLDEDSLAEIGQWPWPRNVVSRLVANLMQMGAAIVAFDIVFAEPDRMNPSDVADAVYGLDDQTRDKLRSLKGNDQAFADVIKESRVVLGQAGYWEERKIKAGPPVKKSVAVKGKSPNNFLPRFKSLVRNVPVIEEAAAKARSGGHGIFSLVPEPDGIVRRVPTLFNYDDNLYPSLAVEMLRLAFQSQTILVEASDIGVKDVKVASKKAFPPDGLSLPTDKEGRVWPYFSKSDKAKYVSAREILAGTADPALIKGKMTIIGTSAVGLLDIRATPVDPVIPGVEVHVQLIEAALTGQYLSRPNFTNGAELILIVFGGLLMVWLVPRLGAKWTLMLLLVLASGAAGASWYFFSEKRILFDAGFAIISILGLYILMTYTSYAREEAQRRQTRDAFSKYLSPAMVEKVAGDPSQLKLGGDKRDMTLLFCDVRGFTTISEQFDAVGLTALINKLLTPLTNVILSNQGTVDKYMGDCIMAFWNAPLDDAKHARNGCLSALGMLAAMGPLNTRLEAEAKAEGRKHIPLKVGAGLNSGECVVGNMGSDQRFDYSVLGDTVNLASRLEGQSKSYGVDIVIGNATRDRAPEMASIELDFIQVKGKTTGIHIFALMGDETVAGQKEFQALKFATEKMIKCYRAQDWTNARECLELCRGLVGNFKISGLYDLYEERIAEYEKNPPPADWNGVFIATSK